MNSEETTQDIGKLKVFFKKEKLSDEENSESSEESSESSSEESSESSEETESESSDSNEEDVKDMWATIKKTYAPSNETQTQTRYETVNDEERKRKRKLSCLKKIKKVFGEETIEPEIEIPDAEVKVKIDGFKYESTSKKPKITLRSRYLVTRYTMDDDLKMLKVIGASKWHAFVKSRLMFQILQAEAFPERTVEGLMIRFKKRIWPNLANYGLSKAEMELYKNGEKKFRFGITRRRLPAYNSNYQDYNLMD